MYMHAMLAQDKCSGLFCHSGMSVFGSTMMQIFKSEVFAY